MAGKEIEDNGSLTEEEKKGKSEKEDVRVRSHGREK